MRTSAVAFVMLALSSAALAGSGALTINANNGRLLVQRLAAQTATYVVYLTDSKTGRIEYSDIWERRLSFSPDGTQVVLDWKWFRAGDLVRSVTAVADRKTFAPVSESASSPKRGDVRFEFRGANLIRSDGAPVPMAEPVFNWEMDLELFALLPIEAIGQTFDIALVDPFEAKPSYKRYAVAREEALSVDPRQAGIATWVLRIEYSPDSWAEFWIAKNSHQVLKMVELYAGKYRYKVRLY